MTDPIMITRDIENFAQSGALSVLDVQFASFIARLAGSDDSSLFLAAALASQASGKGHVCCDLAALAGKELFATDSVEPGLPSLPGASLLICPELSAWCDSLRFHSVVGSPGSFCPLILDDHGRLYLYRYWEYESDLAELIRKRSGEDIEAVDDALLEEGLERYFRPSGPDGEPDWQRIAAAVAVRKRFCVISGGPGTGKTTTVAGILALLVEQAGGEKLRIALAAPTGKAAARLEEAIGRAKRDLAGPQAVMDAIPEAASTLHRLLGPIPGSPYFRRDSRNPLAVDVVIVDEASMVDLALMAKLARSLPPEARLILLGDKDQLASVEAGAVLGDICDTGNAHVPLDLRLAAKEGPGGAKSPGIAGCIVELRKSHRFAGESDIGAVSRAVREGEGDVALALLKDDLHSDVVWHDLPQPEALARALRTRIIQGLGAFLQAESFEQMMAAFERFRILCSLRQGPYGAVRVNQLVESVLREARLIRTGRWYRGRPVMITANDYNLKLFNGDIGIILPDGGPAASGMDPTGWSSGGEEEGPSSMAAFFPSSAGGPPRRLPPARLPPHETVYAMTVHKSQGSEFDEVLLLLSDRESPVLTRELLYTGITRARTRVSVWGREAVLRAAAARRVQRSSGLRDAIWGAE